MSTYSSSDNLLVFACFMLNILLLLYMSNVCKLRVQVISVWPLQVGTVCKTGHDVSRHEPSLRSWKLTAWSCEELRSKSDCDLNQLYTNSIKSLAFYFLQAHALGSGRSIAICKSSVILNQYVYCLIKIQTEKAFKFDKIIKNASNQL